MAAVLQAMAGGVVALTEAPTEVGIRTVVAAIHRAVEADIHPVAAVAAIHPVVAAATHRVAAAAIPAVDIAKHGEGITRSISPECVEWL
jgi:hypothetical protein